MAHVDTTWQTQQHCYKTLISGHSHPARWYKVEDHVVELQQWMAQVDQVSERVLHVLDFFGASQQVTKAFQRGGYVGASFDLKLSRTHDIVSEFGVKTLLRMALQWLGFFLESSMMYNDSSCSVNASCSTN